LNIGYPLETPGLWVERIGTARFDAGRPALFLDRDGTINVDVGYLSTAAAVVLRQEIVSVVRAANRAQVPVVVVTNQSAIARGLFGWSEFAAVNARVLQCLAQQGCGVNMVLACAYHDTGTGELAAVDHPMRKPNPGMLLCAAQILKIDLPHSIMMGDKPHDLEAGRRAGLSRVFGVGAPMAAVENAIREVVARV
jgi:D-glycero-D-manno-heptose 1,7-bisphosphate phosphatase